MILLTIPTSIVNFSKLSILGVNEAYVFGLIILCGLFAIYLIIDPIMQWLIIAGSSKTLSYFVTTLIMLVLLLALLLFNNDLSHLTLHILKIAFSSFSIFGIVLAAGHYLKIWIFRKKIN